MTHCPKLALAFSDSIILRYVMWVGMELGFVGS